MKKLLILVVALAAVGLYQAFSDKGGSFDSSSSSSSSLDSHDYSAISRAFEEHGDGVPGEGQGVVLKLLPDDNQGSRHQRVIVQLDSGQTILLAHNIDLAPRVSPLSEGALVSFSGEYAWNPKGGVVHWTHRDPDGSHTDGWIRSNAKVFQ
jgi:hypothetical protein